MKKTDLIKFRCTPERKAALQREATYRQVTLTELIEEALGWVVPVHGDTPVSSQEPFSAPQRAQTTTDLPLSQYGGQNLPTRCPHGRPSAKLCWECS